MRSYIVIRGIFNSGDSKNDYKWHCGGDGTERGYGGNELYRAREEGQLGGWQIEFLEARSPENNRWKEWHIHTASFLHSYLQNQKNKEIRVGHTTKLLKEIDGQEGQQIVFVGYDVIGLEGCRGRVNEKARPATNR